MKIARGLPPNYEEIRRHFPTDDKTFYTYGDTIYTLQKEIPEDILEHEKVHQKQQGQAPDWWWKRFLIDPQFRKEQEAEAYGVQLRWVRERTSDKVGKECLFDLACALSSPLYGLNISHHEAETLIRRNSK